MSIKQNIKRRMLMVVALAMTVAVLAAGTAHAQAQPMPTSLTQTPSSSEVVVGEPVTFHVTVTNEAPYDISPVAVTVPLSDGAQFVSASSSQGQCTYNPSHGENGDIHCDLGTLPAGGTAQIDIVLVPQKAGVIMNVVRAPMSSSEAIVWVDGAA
jgi:uncharacterized repeat protein (TIGR01451 family)